MEIMIEEKLEIVLITYNRYKDLENTLINSRAYDNIAEPKYISIS